MPQFLALEWNSRAVRVAVASARGRQAVVEHAFTLAIGAEPSAEEGLGQRIARELDARGIGRPETLVAVGRSSIELRQLQLPPAPDADLPDMVRFQAAREFNELDERWLLDFVPIGRAADGPRTVLATAIAPVVVQQIERVCDEAGLKMRRLVLRPCAAAALLAADKVGAADELQLLVDLYCEGADLTAVLDGQAVFLRTTRLSGDPPALPALIVDIRRTIAAVQNQWGGRKVASIVLCGGDATLTEMKRQIVTELGIRTELYDPFGGRELSPALRESLPEHSERFVSLLGALVTELGQGSHAIDFLHPRRRAPPPSRRRQWIAAATVAVLVPLAWLVYSRVEHYLLVDEVDRLTADSKSLDGAMATAKKVSGTVAEIGKWADGETIWLDAIYGLSENFPASEDAALGQLTLGVRPTGRQMELKGWVRRADVIARMEESVRAHAGQINSKSSREDKSVKPYSWRFEASVLLPAGGGPGAARGHGTKPAAAARTREPAAAPSPAPPRSAEP